MAAQSDTSETSRLSMTVGGPPPGRSYGVANTGEQEIEEQKLANSEDQLALGHEESKKEKALRAVSNMKAKVDKLVFKCFSVTDSMTYRAEELNSWNSLWHMSFSIWSRSSLWMVTLRLFGLSFVVAILVLAVVKHPAELKVGKFSAITKFLGGFVGLLLGFFMSTSVNRWWHCAEAFQHLCGAIRNFHMYLNSCGVPDEQTTTVLRYGVVSAWILHMQLHVEAMPEDEQDAALKEGWEQVKSGEGRDPVFGMLTSDEIKVLHHVSDPPSALWMWISSYVGHLAQEGILPPLASPTYGRIVGVSMEGFNAIRDVRSSISMQAPFIYVQMLSSLVHINNIVNALSFGLTWGASIGSLLVHVGLHVSEHQGEEAKASQKQATTDMQTLLVSFFFSCFGPFVYQALLEVSIAIAQPFSNKDAVVPTQRIIHTLEKDLHDLMWLAKNISWTQPCFKK